VDIARHARQIALPEVGPDGQRRIGAARVAVVGSDLAAETAATYLRAAGVGEVIMLVPTQVLASAPPMLVVGSSGWRGSLSDVDLIVRSGFDDTPMDGEIARLGLPVIAVRAQRDAVDMISFSGRAPSPAARPDVPFQAAATPTENEASAVLAGTLAAAEALHVIVREGSGPFAPSIRHLRLPLDGREPLVQEIGARW
jgi:hypothetical protein